MTTEDGVSSVNPGSVSTRHDRARFALFGVLPIINVVAMMLYGLVLSTGVRGGEGASIPVVLGLLALSVLVVVVAAIRRGRDLGWGAGQSILVILVGIGLGPLALVVVGYLALAKGMPGDNAFGAPRAAPGVVDWLWALVLVAVPWFILAVASRTL